MTILDEHGHPYRENNSKPCDHGVVFDESAAKGLDVYEVRKRWPRLFGRDFLAIVQKVAAIAALHMRHLLIMYAGIGNAINRY